MTGVATGPVIFACRRLAGTRTGRAPLGRRGARPAGLPERDQPLLSLGTFSATGTAGGGAVTLVPTRVRASDG
jgi:hypothetical protein